MNLENCIVYDVEIALEVDKVEGRWENPEGMGFGSAVAYSYNLDQYFFFLHEEGRQKLLELLHQETAITFNGIKFDSRVVLGNKRTVGFFGETKILHNLNREGTWSWDNIDLLLEYVKARFNYENVAQAEGRLGDKAIHDGSFSLDGLAEGTLGLKKTGHGALAPILYQEKRYDKLLDYNLNDVRLTKKLFEFVIKYNFLVDRAGRVVRINLAKME